MKKIIFSLLILLILGLGGIYFFMEPMILKKMNEAFDQVFATEARLEGIDLHFSDSRFSMNGLQIANPAGFERKEFLTLSQTSVKIQPSSLLEKTVVLEELSISDLYLQIAYDGTRINTDVLSPIEEGPKKSSWDKEILIRNLQVNGLKLFVLTPGRSKEINIPNIEIENLRIGKSPLPPAVHAIRQILDRILKESMQKYKEQYKQEIRSRLEDKVMKKVGTKLKELGIEEDNLKDAANSLKDKLKKLF